MQRRRYPPPPLPTFGACYTRKAGNNCEIWRTSFFVYVQLYERKGHRRSYKNSMGYHSTLALELLKVQTGDMKRRPGNGIEVAMVCTSLGRLLRPLFYFLVDVSYPQSVQQIPLVRHTEIQRGVNLFELS